jgi:uncharacterized Ntn-hydrolase superfamily protein
MTFSIVACAPAPAGGTTWGVAVASKFLAVGAAVPAAAVGAGAIATQAHVNLAYRPEGLALLARGHAAGDVLAALTAADTGREARQAGAVDRDGRGATYTGGECHPWAGGVAGAGYAIQGNILSGPEVVAAMAATWLADGPERPLARRLLAALAAGEAAGGDRRGRQSAALLVVEKGRGYAGTSDAAVDLRVDDHPAPIPELARLLDLHDAFRAELDEALDEVGGAGR